MKTAFKSVFAAFAALFLSITLSGCSDEGSKTASQGGEASHSVFQTTKEGVPDSNGVATFRLPKGVNEISVTYESAEVTTQLLPRLEKELADVGVKITSLDRIGSREAFIHIDVLKDDVAVRINTTGIFLLKPYKRSGLAFQWVAIEGFVPIK